MKLRRLQDFRVIGGLILATFILSFPNALAAKVWNVGREYEVDEGYYMTLLEVKQGWRLWKIETQSGVSCKAVKSAQGQIHPEPVGVADLFYKGAPYVEVSEGITLSKETIYRFRLRGTYGSGKAEEYRAIGDKFWTSWTPTTDLTPFNGSKIEVHAVTYEYDAIFVGRVDDKGVIDLSGLEDMIGRVNKCAVAAGTGR